MAAYGEKPMAIDIPRAKIYDEFGFFANKYGTKTLSRRNFYEQFAERFRWRHEHGLATSKRQTHGYKNIELLDEEATIAAIGSLSFSEIRQQAEDSIHDSSERE